MKTIKLFLLLVVTGFITMSMGFPTDLAADKNNQENEDCPTASVSPVVVMSKAAVDEVEEEPVHELSLSLLSTGSSKITLKVFDAKGALVIKQQVTMDEFLGKSKKATLPNGSIFVMFHENTAYYFLETGLLN